MFIFVSMEDYKPVLKKVKRGRKPNYELRDRVIAALCVNPNFTDVAKDLHTDRNTVAKIYYDNEELIKCNVKTLAPKVLEKATKILDSISDTNISDANLTQKVSAWKTMLESHININNIDNLRKKEQQNTIIVINLNDKGAKGANVNGLTHTIKNSSLNSVSNDTEQDAEVVNGASKTTSQYGV